MPTLEDLRQKNSEAINNAISELDVINYDTVSELLPKLLAEGLLTLDASAYPPADATTTDAKGIGRYLVYDHPDEANPFSIWTFAFAPRQKTCIHDHKYKGVVTVLEGPVSEKFYQPTGDRLAQRVGRTDRHRFHTKKDDLDPNDPYVHQLKRRKGLGEGTSVTLHIYNMQAHIISAESTTDRRNLKTIFTKDPSSNKGDYEQLHSSVRPK